MNITNTVINSIGLGGAALVLADALKSKKVTNLGNLSAKNDTAQLVTLTHRASTGGVTNIYANTPPNFNLELSADWAPRNGMPTLSDVSDAAGGEKYGKLAKSVADATNLGGATLKFLTAHYWEGASPIQGTIAFEFIVEDDADMQVIKPLVHLYRMVAPDELGPVLLPPGPSVLGTALGGEKITIRLGNTLTFENVVITSVSGEIDTRLSMDGKIMHAKVDVTFKSFFTTSRADISKIFGVSDSMEEKVGIK